MLARLRAGERSAESTEELIEYLLKGRFQESAYRGGGR
jgi:hypothetical protein